METKKQLNNKTQKTKSTKEVFLGIKSDFLIINVSSLRLSVFRSGMNVCYSTKLGFRKLYWLSPCD